MTHKKGGENGKLKKISKWWYLLVAVSNYKNILGPCYHAAEIQSLLAVMKEGDLLKRHP